MEFFNGIGKRVNKVVRNVSEKTATGTSTARVAREIAALQEKREQLFAALGKACFAAQNCEGDEGEVQALCQQVADSQAREEALKKELDALNGVRRCPECGTVLPKEARFCISCGTRQPEPEPEPEPEAEKVFCPNCGAAKEDEGAFCPVCGAAYDGSAPAEDDEAPAEEVVEIVDVQMVQPDRPAETQEEPSAEVISEETAEEDAAQDE